VTGQELQLVDRNALVSEARQCLVSQVVPVKVDLPKRFAFESPHAARARGRLDAVSAPISRSRISPPVVSCESGSQMAPDTISLHSDCEMLKVRPSSRRGTSVCARAMTF
jgi:hypothetical protein